MDLPAAALKGVEATVSAGAVDAEAYVVEEVSREVRVHARAVESLTAATSRGVGIRAWIGGRVGYAYGTDLSATGIDETAGRAAAGAALADPDEFAAPPRPGGAAAEIEGIRDPELSAWDAGRVASVALAVEAAALAADHRVSGVEQAVYADASERVAIRSSAGLEGFFEASSCYAYLQAMAQGDRGLQTGLGFGLARGPGDLDPELIGGEAAERAISMIGARKPASRACPVILDPTVAASFAGLIGTTLGADAVQRGRSPFSERLGEEIAGPALRLADDGLDPAGLATSPFDAEGVPRRRTPLIDAGRLQTFLHDTYTARRGGTASTASAGRSGYRSTPSVSASNLIVGEGTADLAGLLGETGEGVYVTDVSGLHSGVNPVSGVFSVGASGRTISGGELGQPVREFTIAGDLVGMVSSVSAAGSDSRWVPFGGSVRTPHLLVGEMTVSGS